MGQHVREKELLTLARQADFISGGGHRAGSGNAQRTFVHLSLMLRYKITERISILPLHPSFPTTVLLLLQTLNLILQRLVKFPKLISDQKVIYGNNRNRNNILLFTFLFTYKSSDSRKKSHLQHAIILYVKFSSLSYASYLHKN